MARWSELPEGLKGRANDQPRKTEAEKDADLVHEMSKITIKDLNGATRRKKSGKGETANRITANVLRIINMTPCCVAYRINNVGVWDAAKGVHRGGNTEKGLPDVWGCCCGLFFVVEVKAGKDKLSEHQEKRRFEIQRSKGFFMVANSTEQFAEEWERFLKK